MDYRRRDSISGSAGDSCEVPSVSLSTKTSAMPIVANPDETGSTHTPVGGKDLTGAQVLESELGSSVGSKCDSMQPTSQITGNSSQTLDASHLTSPGESTRFADRPHLIDANTGHENETRTHASETQNRETTTNSSTTVNISGAKFDLGELLIIICSSQKNLYLRLLYVIRLLTDLTWAYESNPSLPSQNQSFNHSV